MATPRPVRSFGSLVCQSCRQRLLPRPRRQFATSTPIRAESLSTPEPDKAIAGLGKLASDMSRSQNRQRPESRPASNPASNPFTSVLDGDSEQTLWGSAASGNYDMFYEDRKPFRLHVYAHKHNTHLTFVQPSRAAADTASSRTAGAKTTAAEQNKKVDTLLSISAGNIGFRKAGRGSYDAAFQLTAFAIKQIEEKGMLRDCKSLEVVLRGFGAGREAVTKVLLGSEGRNIRNKITSVKDATRLKQGGPRSPKPRRLG